MLKNLCGLSLASILFVACSGEKKNDSTALESHLLEINEDVYRQHLAVLAHDSLEGRKPATNGEAKTITYLSNEFSKLGLQPGNGDSYFQEVPLVEIDSKVPKGMTIEGHGKSVHLNFLDDFVGGSSRVQDISKLSNSELVFVGYGIVAPEFGWNDYEGLDMKGKTAVVLVNDPGFADSTLFRGNNMTYYGRWTYKFEEAARQGAEGVLIVHDTAPASYGWNVVRSSWGKSRLQLQSKDNNMSRAAVEGWLSMESAVALFEQAGQSKDLLRAAAKKGFKSVPLGLKASTTIHNTIKKSISHNVVATIPGTERPDEYIIYSAHWDHFGFGEAIDGDSIYNGAVDNATGTASLLTIAKAFMNADVKPKRSIMFLAVTAEEQGLLGSAYYASNPIIAPAKTVAAINIDALPPLGPVKDLIVIGKGQSELDEYAEKAAKKFGKYTIPEADQSKGYYYRSDHFSFAKIGIPAIYTETGSDSKTKGKEWGEAQKKIFTEKHYHAPSDNYSPEWDTSGSIEDIRIFFDLGYTLSQEESFPKWKSGSEFKLIRENSLK